MFIGFSTSLALLADCKCYRAPLNVVPAWIVQILQTGVALNRVAVYLEEDEVTAQVSSLKKDATQPPLNQDEVGLGLAQVERGRGVQR